MDSDILLRIFAGALFGGCCNLVASMLYYRTLTPEQRRDRAKRREWMQRRHYLPRLIPALLGGVGTGLGIYALFLLQ